MDPKRKAGAIKELELARQKRAANNESKEVDPYSNLKSCQKQVEFMNIQEDHVKDDIKNLRQELVHGKEEIKRIQSVPLAVGQFINMVDEINAIVKSSTGYKEYLVWVLSTINRELSTPSASVALHLHSHALVDVLPPQVDSRISLLSHSEKPDVIYSVRYSRVILCPHIGLVQFLGSISLVLPLGILRIYSYLTTSFDFGLQDIGGCDINSEARNS